MSDLLKNLQMAFRSLPDKAFCIADALDEMDSGQDALLEAVGSLGQWKPAKIKVLITSRPVPEVETPLPKHQLSIFDWKSNSSILGSPLMCMPSYQNRDFREVSGA